MLLDKDKPAAFKKPIDNASITLYTFENGKLLTAQDGLQQPTLTIDNFTVTKINDKVQMHSALRQLSLFGTQDKTSAAPNAAQQDISYLHQ